MKITERPNSLKNFLLRFLPDNFGIDNNDLVRQLPRNFIEKLFSMPPIYEIIGTISGDEIWLSSKDHLHMFKELAIAYEEYSYEPYSGREVKIHIMKEFPS